MKGWLTHYPGAMFACCVIVREDDGYRRCGKQTDVIKHIGGNDIEYPICREHLKSEPYPVKP